MAYDNRGVIEHQIKQWVRDQVLAKHFNCKNLVLRHLNLDNRPQGDVSHYDVPVGDLTPAHDVDLIVDQIMAAAQSDADSIGGSVQQYAVYATFENSDFTPRKVFRVSSQTDFERDVSPSEPPNEKGLTAQTMRHLEVVMRTTSASHGYILSLLERQVQRLQDKDERSEQQKIDMMLLIQDVIDGAHSRRLEERKAEASQGMRENALEYLKVAAPIILNRIAGRPILPEKNKAFMLLASLLENLSPEQQAFLRDGLNPSQLSLLAEIMGEYEKDKAAFEGVGEATRPPSPAETSMVPSGDPGQEKAQKPPKIFQSLQDRLLEKDNLPKDPFLRRLEERGEEFTRHLASEEKKPGE
jgi:hypothetical protein